MAVSIAVRDGIAYLDVPDAELMEAVVDATSFKAKDADYRLRQRKDKRYKLVRNNKCPIGLLDRVCRVIQTMGAEVQLKSANSEQAPKPKLALRLRDVELRDYQEEAGLAAVLNDRGVFRAPTGSGKTLIGAQIIQARGMHALVIVPTIDLLRQYRGELADHLLVAGGMQRIGQLGDGVVDPLPVTVATIRTIAKVLDVAYETYEYAEYDDRDDTDLDPKALRQWVQDVGTVIVDEAHILGAKTVYEVTTRMPALCKYGMSASPWRDDGADLMIEAATGPVIFYVPAKRLVDDGYLMAPEVRVKDTSDWWASAAWGTTCARCHRQHLQWTAECECGSTQFRSQFTEAYRKEIVENGVRNAKIAEIVAALDRPTLVLVKQVRHGRALAAMLPRAQFLSGRDAGEFREQTFDRVRSGQLQTIICTTISDMGLDIPRLGALVLAGGGKSSTRHLQRIGRVVRPAPGKARPVVVDFNDGHIHNWFANHERERRKIEKAEWGDLITWHKE